MFSANVKLGNFEMQQNVDFILSNKDTLILGGTITSNNKKGKAAMNATLRRILSADTYLDVLIFKQLIFFFFENLYYI
jgi:hypothetical protein